jgi:hypothetical protein
MLQTNSQKLVSALEPLVWKWKYAEEIITRLRLGLVSEEDIKEISSLLLDVRNKAEADERLIQATIAYETVRAREREEKENEGLDGDFLQNALKGL